jgi:hypothetical protein
VKKGTIMSLNPTSLVNTQATSPTAYVPLNRQTKHRIEVPEDPQEILNLVKDLYEQASVPTFEEKAKAPYRKHVDPWGEITLEPNQDFEGPTYMISRKGQVLVRQEPYELNGVLDVKEQATDPKVIEEVQGLIDQAKPQEEIPERSLEVGYTKCPNGALQLLKKGIDGTDRHYLIDADGSVVAYQTNEKTHTTTYGQQMVKPGELCVPNKDGEERPVGQALNEATATEEAKAPANGQVLNLEA